MCTTTKHRDRVRRIPRRKITSRFGGREGVKTGQEGRHQGDTGRGVWRWSRTLEEIEGEARWAGGAGWEGAAHAHSQPPTCALAHLRSGSGSAAAQSRGHSQRRPCGAEMECLHHRHKPTRPLEPSPRCSKSHPLWGQGGGQHRVHLLRKGGSLGYCFHQCTLEWAQHSPAPVTFPPHPACPKHPGSGAWSYWEGQSLSEFGNW